MIDTEQKTDYVWKILKVLVLPDTPLYKALMVSAGNK